MEFSRLEYWSRWPFPSPGDLSNQGIEPRSPSLRADSLSADPQGKLKNPGVGSLSLLQQIFPTQELSWSLLHGRQILYQLIYEGSPHVMRDVPSTMHIPEYTLECCTHAVLHTSAQFSSVTQSCLTLCDPMNRSTPGRGLFMATSLHIPRASMSEPTESQAVSFPLSISFLGFFSPHLGPLSGGLCTALTF